MNNSMIKKMAAYGIFTAGVLLALYYILFGMRAEYGVLSSDNMMDAVAAVESGTIVNRGFWYGYSMPVNASLVMTALVKIIGTKFAAVKTGMLICTAILVICLVLLFRSVGIDLTGSLTASGISLMLLFSSDTMRTTVFSHVTYYMTAFMAVCLIWYCFRFIERYTETGGSSVIKKRIVYCLVFLISAAACMNGYHIVMMFTLPVLITLIIEQTMVSDSLSGPEAKDSRLKTVILIAGLLFGSIFGMLIRRRLFGNISYENDLTVFSGFDSWFFRDSSFLKQWVTLFTGSIPEETNMMTAGGIFVMLHYLTALVILVLPVFALISLRHYRDRMMKLYVIDYWVTFLTVYMIFSLGNEQFDNWRLIGLAVMAVTVSCMHIYHLIAEREDKKITMLQMSMIPMITAFVCCLTNILITTAFIEKENPADTITHVLQGHGLTYGYASFNNNANLITVLSDFTVKVRPIEIYEDGSYRIERYENEFAWYEDQPDTSRYFVIVDRREKGFAVDTLVKAASEIIETEDVSILVFEGNIFAEGQPMYYNES
ncbi:MAG: hypothetical protein K5886_07785 [Lachnospiraceae bacterium]|nr:hypothetical protein [Lachnospiraceae bacterium]